MKLFTFGIIASLVYFNATSGALTKMTQADCNAGIQAACEQLAKWDVLFVSKILAVQLMFLRLDLLMELADEGVNVLFAVKDLRLMKFQKTNTTALKKQNKSFYSFKFCYHALKNQQD